MRIGCSTISLAPLSGEAAVRTLADLGFEVIDIAAVPTVFDHIRAVDGDPEQPARFAALLQELGVEVNAVPTVVWVPNALDDLEELRRRCVAAADVAAAVRAPAWIVDAGQPADGDRDAGLERFRRTLAMQRDVAREHGLRLVVEMPHAGTLAERFADVREVLAAAVDMAPEVGVDFDTSHAHNCGAAVRDLVAAYGERIAHVAVRDTVGPHEWGMPLGEGHVDFVEVLDALGATGFDGDLMLELEPDRASLDERLGLIKHGRAHLERVLA